MIHRFIKEVSRKIREQLRFRQPTTVDAAISIAIAYYHSLDENCDMGYTQSGLSENTATGRSNFKERNRSRSKSPERRVRFSGGGNRNRSRSKSLERRRERSRSPPRSRTPDNYHPRYDQRSNSNSNNHRDRRSQLYCKRCRRDTHNTKDCYAKDEKRKPNAKRPQGRSKTPPRQNRRNESDDDDNEMELGKIDRHHRSLN